MVIEPVHCGSSSILKVCFFLDALYIQIFFLTLVEAAGLQSLDPCPKLSNTSMLCTEGSSLMPLLEEPSISEWKKAVFWQYPR